MSVLSHWKLCFLFYLTVQAPVSDREYQSTLPQTAAMIDLAAKMISEGRGPEIMPREADPSAPITAYRWVYINNVAVQMLRFPNICNLGFLLETDDALF